MMRSSHLTSGNYWAMWWGVTLAMFFVVAATLSFTMDDRGIRAASALSYDLR